MNVVIIGSSGRVGRMVAAEVAREHHVRLADLAPSEQTPGDIEFVSVDVTDVASLRRALDEQDALIYLAMGRNEGWGTTGGWAESHFDVNVKGLYLALRAAAETGVGKAVYASSLSIFGSFLAHGHELEDREPDATDAYGLTKGLGEQVARAAAAEHGTSVVALRLCAPLPDDEYWAYRGHRPEIRTAASDVAAAFRAALAYPADGFEAFTICGDHEERYVSWQRTRDRLGWTPKMRMEAR